ncbi:hypothetical protein MMC13_001543 [Lambiella insularis]|nr:hypothetical protein [Lambiella insularis]
MAPVTAFREGVKIEIVSDGQSLPLYPDPEEEIYQDFGQTAETTTTVHIPIPQSYQTYYVEALEGKKFSIRTTITETFDMKSGDTAILMPTLDGKDILSREVPKDRWLSNNKNYVQERSDCSSYDAKTKQWTRAKFGFGKLETRAQSVESENNIEMPAHLDKLGSIEMTVTRAMRTSRGTPKPMSPSYGEHQSISRIPEKMLKGKGIVNSVEFVKGSVTATPTNNHSYQWLKGGDAKPVHFRILYRSRGEYVYLYLFYAVLTDVAAVLQMLRCIPRTPSPDIITIDAPPDLAHEIQKARVSINIYYSIPETSLIALKDHLALLERQANIKPESTDNKSSTSASSRIKRERNKDESPQSSKRHRPHGEIQTVDLTGD